jgi:hypothetical protein
MKTESAKTIEGLDAKMPSNLNRLPDSIAQDARNTTWRGYVTSIFGSAVPDPADKPYVHQ